jgi:hypothetical protein
MRADNETRIDLPGFDFLDELLVVLRDPCLLPAAALVAPDDRLGHGEATTHGWDDDELPDIAHTWVGTSDIAIERDRESLRSGSSSSTEWVIRA